MAKSVKPLCFRRSYHGGSTFKAQRDHVEYRIHYQKWMDGEAAKEPFSVSIWDPIAKVNVSTARTHRFPDYDTAKDFCQAVYEGLISLESLKAEADAEAEAVKSRHEAAVRAGVDSFQALLADRGVALKDFLAAYEAWVNLGSDCQTALFNISDEESGKTP